MTLPNLPFYTEHWYSEQQAARLAQLAFATDGLTGIVVEIGCWQGISTIVLAQAVAPVELIAIDHWQGQVEAPHTQKLAQARDIFAEFTANLAAAGVLDRVCIIRGDWADGLTQLGAQPVRFAHLDDGHTTEAVTGQIRALWPLFQRGGILAGDDWGWPSVRAAVVAELPGAYAEGNLWWAQKT